MCVSSNIAFGRVALYPSPFAGRILLLHHGAASPTDQEWEAYLQYAAGLKDDFRQARILVHSMGGRPTRPQVQQNKQLLQVTWAKQEIETKVAVYTTAGGIGQIVHTLLRAGVALSRTMSMATTGNSIHFAKSREDALRFLDLWDYQAAIRQGMDFLVVQLQMPQVA